MQYPLDWEHLQWHLQPVAIQIGPLAVRWYGLMYAVAFTVAYLLVMYRLRHETWEFNRDHIDKALTWMVGGVLIGGRLGYVIFYGWDHFSKNPLEIFVPFSRGIHGNWVFTGISGMSFHGGVVGFAVAMLWFCHRERLVALRFADLFVPAIPLGYTFGRIGNFLNGELWGRVTDVSWAMRFPADTTSNLLQGMPPPLRHPSQLYEAIGEGVVLWIILWTLRNRHFFQGRMFACYLIGYGMIRFFIEYTREPDSQLGLVLGPLTMGQILCWVMILAGVALLRYPGQAPSLRG